MIHWVLQISPDKWFDVNAWFMSKVNYVLDRSNLKVKMIDWIIPKVENIFKPK